ncbi:MAG: hypothetical protein ACHRXM_16220 [Isosphaerales bacterium]
MRLYVDDDSVDPGLIRLLRRDGHDVQLPADVGLAGSSDQVHLAHAIRHRRAILFRVEPLAIIPTPPAGVPPPCWRAREHHLLQTAASVQNGWNPIILASDLDNKLTTSSEG